MQDISRQIGIGLRWLPLIVVGALAAGLIAYSFSSSQPTLYEASAKLVVEPGQGASTTDEALARSAAVRYAEQAVSRPVVQSVIKRLGLTESVEDVQERIVTSVEEDTLEFIVDARGPDPESAKALAVAVGNEMRQRVRNSLITGQVKAADEAIRANQVSTQVLENRLRTLRNKRPKTSADWDEIAILTAQISDLQRDIVLYRPTSSAFVGNLAEWSERPILPEDPVEPRPLYWTMLALVAGTMLAAGLAFTLEYLRSVGKVSDDRDLELATGQATLGAVMETGRDARRKDADRLVTLNYPRSDEAEAYRGLIARVGFSGGTSRTIMVTSAHASDAKSVVAANLAVAYAEAGRNVILVDADYRAPRIHSFFGVANDRGLTSILTDSTTPLGWATVPSAHPRLGLMPAGPLPREAADPLGAAQLNALLRRLLQAADMVVLASPPIASSLDAAVLAEGSDGALLVVPRDSKEDETVEAARALQSADAEFVGAVLYRHSRRSRKGARAKVPSAPKGWGPTWPMLNEQPAQIPAATRSTATGKPEASRRAHPSTTTPQQPPPRQQAGPVGGPYAVPFAAQPTAAGTAAATPTTAGPPAGAPARVNPAAAPGAVRATTTPPSATPAQAAPAKAYNYAAATPAQAAPSTPTSSRSSTEGARVAIPVQPDESAEPGSEAEAAGSAASGAGKSQAPTQTRPGTIPG